MLKKLLSVITLTASALFALPNTAQAIVPAICTGLVYNPITDTDWNNMFPISVAGVPISSGGNTPTPLQSAIPPICVCPSALGVPLPGITVTYWQPLYVAEVEQRPGCLSTLGGVSSLGSLYTLLGSEQHQSTAEAPGQDSNRMQVHWYTYPVFGVMDMMKNLGCKTTSGFNLGYMTELDPIWQSDVWSAIMAPESILFASPPAQLACAVDAVASSLEFPLDPLFWCQGTWGNTYPLAGNSSHSGHPFSMNNQILGKFIARSHRMLLMFQTTGPTALCGSHPNPVWTKSQYRYNQIGPFPRKGRAVSTGSAGLLQFPPIANLPTQEHTNSLIWQGQVCCMKPIP